MAANTCENTQPELSVSRRSFVRLAVSTLTVLPAVAGGFLLPGPPTQALADEVDDTTADATSQASADPARIVVVSPKEVGFYIADQAQDCNAPIAGAHVVVTSLFNGAVLDDYSKEDGMVTFDISDLAEDEDKVNGVYAFNGTIDITVDGYREFHVMRTRIEGHSAVSVPTRKLEPNRPYPARASIDGWDILYTKNGFVSTTGNDCDIPFDVDIYNLEEPAVLTLHARGEDKTYASVPLSPTGGKAKATFSDKFLQLGTDKALPVGGEFYMQIETSDAIYEFPIALQVKPGFVSAMSKDENAETSPVNSSTSPDAFNVTIPNFVPFFKNQKLNMWTPKSRFTFVVDPYGYVYFAYKTPRVGYISDAGTTEDDKWGVHSYADATTQYEKFVDSNFGKIFDTVSALSKGSLLTHVKFSPSLTAAVSARFTLAGKWDWGEHTLQGDASLLGLLEVLFSMTEQFGLGPVPVYLSLTINANAAAALGCGVYASDALDLSTYTWDYTNTGFTVTINLMGSIAAGIGIAGVASIGARGTLGIMMYLGVTPKPDPALETPHAIIGFSGSAAVEVQLFLFKWSGTFWSFSEPNYKDNWRKGVLGSEDPSASVPDDFRLASGSYSYECPASATPASNKTLWETLFQDATPVTAAELETTAEVALVSAAGEAPLYDLSQAVVIPPGEDDDFGTTVYPWDEDLIASSSRPDDVTVLNAPRIANAPLGVSGVDLKNGGVWPTKDVRVMGSVFSDPRTKTVVVPNPRSATYDRITYVFRIASAKVNGEMRTRLVYQELVGDELYPSSVVNFQTGLEYISRDDLFDYDFDVITSEDGNRLYLFLISGVRPNGDGTSPYEAFENTVFSYFEVDVHDGVFMLPYIRHFTWKAMNENVCQGKKNAFFCPSVVYLKDEPDGTPFVAFAWLHRFVRDASVPLESDAAELAIGTGYAYSGGISIPPIELAFKLSDNTGYDLVTARGEGEYDDEINLHYAVRSESGTTGAYVIVLPPADGRPPAMRNLFETGTIPLVGRLVQWHGEGNSGFLVAHDNKLQRALAVRGSEVFSFTEVAPFDFGTNSFGLDETGHVIFYSQNKHGIAGYEYDEDGNPTPIEVHENRIMASKLYKGAFCDPYVLANVSHTIEGITFASQTSDSLNFLVTAIDDFSSSSASLWYTAVPAVSAATILGMALMTPLVAPGDDARFLVTLRNDGNVHLTGATVEMVDESGSAVASTYVPFGEDTLQASVWNPPEDATEGNTVVATPQFKKATTFMRRRGFFSRAASQVLLNTSEDYELAPGKTGVYAAMLTVPEGWEGDHQVTLRVKSTTWVKTAGIEMEDDPILLASTAPGEGETLQVTRDAGVDNDVNQDAPVSVQEKGGDEPEPEPEPSGGSEPEPSGGGEPSGSGGSGGSVPNTGDESVAPLAAAAVAAVGVAAVACSAAT